MTNKNLKTGLYILIAVAFCVLAYKGILYYFREKSCRNWANAVNTMHERVPANYNKGARELYDECMFSQGY